MNYLKNSHRQPHLWKLTRAAEFQAVLAADCRLSSRNFLMRAGLNTSTVARLGLIASRKVARRAVDRNRVKRLAREAFHASRASLPAVDVVFQLKNDLHTSANASIRKELNKLLRELPVRFTKAAASPAQHQSEQSG